ncbi:hypothetical protein K474DRAFT_1711797 [Panus rudis PR-1116 ss-1]|nr:hypothetical protein K474DRAFT_1711797 [Panus rudis PR-1116 ss-1]
MTNGLHKSKRGPAQNQPARTSIESEDPPDNDDGAQQAEQEAQASTPTEDEPPSADDALNTILISLQQRGASAEEAEAIISKALGERLEALRLRDHAVAPPPPPPPPPLSPPRAPSPASAQRPANIQPPAREPANQPPAPSAPPSPGPDDLGSSISCHVSRQQIDQPSRHSSTQPSRRSSRSPAPSAFAPPDPKSSDPPPINPTLTVPDHIARPIAPIAEKKLREYKYIELYYFTRAGRDEAAGLAARAESDDALNLVSKGSKISLEPSENARTLSNVIRDEKLTWAQLEDAIAAFENEAIRAG